MLHATPATYSAPRGGDETDGFVLFGDTNSKLYEWLTMTHSDILTALAPVIVFVVPTPVVEHRAFDPAVHEASALVVKLASSYRCAWPHASGKRGLMTRPRPTPLLLPHLWSFSLFLLLTVAQHRHLQSNVWTCTRDHEHRAIHGASGAAHSRTEF